MRNYLVLIVLVLSAVNFSSCQKRVAPTRAITLEQERARLIVDEHANLTPAVIALMKITGVDETLNLHDAIAPTQKSWLRPNDQERDILDEKYGDRVSDMMQHFKNLGLVDTVMPAMKRYDYVLLLGATYRSFQERLSFFETLVHDGLEAKSIVLLGSHRLLERAREIEPMSREHLLSTTPLTEIDMMETLFGMLSLKSVDTKKVISIASPMKVLDDGRIVRATTRDTVEDFLRAKKRPGSVLVISSQPFLLRQHLVVRKALGAGWTVETVGIHAASTSNTSVLLDELARTLYELHE